MRHVRYFLLALLIIITLATVAWATEYLWFTESETNQWGEHIRFSGGDTLDGPVRSNDQLAPPADGQVVFLDTVFNIIPIPWPDGFVFRGPILSNAPPLYLPKSAEALRSAAHYQNLFFDDLNRQYLAVFLADSIMLYDWPLGTYIDSSHAVTIRARPQLCLFVDGPLRVRGRVHGQWTVGCSADLLIDGDVRYVDADSLTGNTSLLSLNYLGLVAEGDIKIRNTPENGRWNSNGLGMGQPNLDSTSVVITAALRALGESFTFEQQNDPDSCYVCLDCPGNGQDERGYVHVFGSVYQKRRGYMHRSTLGSTGYRMKLRYDRRLRQMLPPCLPSPVEEVALDPDTLNFGSVPLDSVAWDTLDIQLLTPAYLYSVNTSHPFQAFRLQPYYGNHFRIPVRFAPNQATYYSGSLTISLGPYFLQVPLRGRGVTHSAPPLRLSAAPNPCNLSTVLRYTLPAMGQVKLTLFDVLGRVAKQVDVPVQAAGEHTLHLDLSGLASGVYFTQIEAANQRVTQKLLLLK